MNNIPTEYKTQHSVDIALGIQIELCESEMNGRDLKTEAVILEALESQDTGH